MPIHRGVAGGVLAEVSLANQKLTIQELKAISFLREPEYMTPLSDLLQQSPHHAAESNETVSIDGCRPRLNSEVFPKSMECAVFLSYLVAPTCNAKADIAIGIARVVAGLTEETNRSQSRPEATDTTCAMAGQLPQLDGSLLVPVHNLSEEVQPAPSEISCFLKIRAIPEGIGFQFHEGCRLFNKSPTTIDGKQLRCRE